MIKQLYGRISVSSEMQKEIKMKTVNFLEALEKNKTRSVICLKNRGYFKVGELHDETKNESFSLSVIQSEWQIEPEVVEFECEWIESTRFFGKVDCIIPDVPYTTLEAALNKRTKVRIEVVE